MIVRALIVAAAVAATTVGLAAPAWAGQNVSARVTGNNLGDPDAPPWVYAAFHHEGDWLQLVDNCDDLFLGYLQVRNGAEQKTYYVAKKGESHQCGQRWVNRNFREGRDIGIRACTVRPADPDHCSPWRWGIA
jgi:hypothetical protein